MSTADLRCRFCAAHRLRQILSLGRTPLANSILSQAQLSGPEPLFPLELFFCEGCGLVQIGETVPREQLFSHYLYFSSFADATLRSAEELAQRLTAQLRLGPASLVMEVASNDGYLLQFYQQAGVPVLGVEPAENVATVAKLRGIPTRRVFFDLETAQLMRDEGLIADVIHANNVLAHVPDLKGFVRGIERCLKDDGMAVIEVPHVRELVDNLEFDTIYHEHVFYFSLTALARVFRSAGLELVDVERLAIHGGSLRLFVKRGGHPSTSVKEMLALEGEAGLDQAAFFERFAERVEGLRRELRDLLYDLKRRGHTLAAYGASAKGSTLLNYCGIGRDVLDFVVDRSPAKQGLYMPGSHLAIESPAKLLETRPDYVLLLTWNFTDEILEQQVEYLNQGGRFISPIPTPKVLSTGERHLSRPLGDDLSTN